MVLMSVISSMILLWWCYTIIRRHDFVVSLALVAKVSAGFALGLLYKFYLGGGDTFQYFHEGKTIALYFIDHPNQIFPIYFKTLHLNDLADQIVFYDQPRALLFAKFISVCFFFSGGNYWIISAFLSITNFVFILGLVEELKKTFQVPDYAFDIPFFFLPTFVFWTSGLLKESPAIAALAMLITLVLRFIRTKQFGTWLRWMSGLVASVILWELKYFYAAIALPILFSLPAYSFLKKKGRVVSYISVGIFFVGLLLMSFLHYNLSLSRVSQVVYENYQQAVLSGNGSEIHYYKFDGSMTGFLINVPFALFAGLFRPLIFDVNNILQALVMTENTAVLVVLIFGLFRTKFHLSLHNPFVTATLVYVFLLACLLAYSAPNLGTLSRYKVAYWPFFVTLVLLLPGHKKSQIHSESDF